jgi:predicted HicB family RNase H-like nuclease
LRPVNTFFRPTEKIAGEAGRSYYALTMTDADTTKRRRGRPPGQVLTDELRVRMEPEMREDLEAAAKAEGVPAAALARRVIAEYLAQRRPA